MTMEGLETKLTQLDKAFERVGESTLLVPLAPGLPSVVLHVSEPVVVAQVVIGPAAAAGAEVLRKLLELNATDLVQASYGISGDKIVLSAAHQLSSLDLNELAASLVDFDLALAEHVGQLRSMMSEN